jgi:DNA (cytosine-5)-methyltransferase 1
MNYYNEHDTKAAAWLRELINAGLIPNGDVDERSITEVQPNELRQYTQCHFFAGIGGWSLALQLAGWPADRPVWTGSCPCQPFSAAGKGLAQADERHLWPVFFNLIRQCRPEHVFGEQVASAIGKGWLDGISSDLESEGYACGATVFGAHSVSAPHIRQRLYWMADSDSGRFQQRDEGIGSVSKFSKVSAISRMADSDGTGSQPRINTTQTSGHRSSIEPDGATIGLANSISKRGCSRESWDEDARDAGITGEADRPSGMVNPIEQGLQGQHRPTEMELHRGERSERSTGPTGFWDQYAIIPCRDGKSRRIECQSRRLADGIPTLVDSVRDAGATEEQIEAAINPFPLVKKQLGRTILLKGYGNAIVPQVAAEFIKAFLES